MEANAEGLSATGAYLFGRLTYEKMAAFWPTGPSDVPFTSHLNNAPKYVASTTLRNVNWQKTSLLEGDGPKAVKELKDQQGGDIVILGSGKRLFPDDHEMRKLRLINSRTTSKGAVTLTYQPI